MPIYEYRLETGDTIEVFQKTWENPYKMLGEIDPELILTPGFDKVSPGDKTKIERVASAPGGFRGLPTPKFHR